MELYINSPAYFKSHYGIDDDVYKFFQTARLFFLDTEYSDTLRSIGIMLVAAPQELYDGGSWKESMQLIGNKSCASISIRLNFEEYLNANSVQKTHIIKKAILGSVKKIKSRCKFDYTKFEQDFNTLLPDE